MSDDEFAPVGDTLPDPGRADIPPLSRRSVTVRVVGSPRRRTGERIETMTLAEILTAERDRLGLTNSELARRVVDPRPDSKPWKPSQVQRLLTGATENPGILTVRELLAAMGRDLKWLARKLDG